ncbi:MAG: nuclear transport factor 2 family protein, partial [Acidobacteriota bacterium]
VMLSRRVLIVSLILVLSAAAASAQNTNSSTTSRPRATNSNENKSTVAPKSTAAPKTTVAPKTTATPKTGVAPKTSTEIQGPVITPPTARHAAPKPRAVTEVPGAADVVAAFNSLLEGIRHANVKAVAGAYQNSPRLLLFNNNGTVTRGWDQMRINRESSYPDVKDVKLDVKDVQITILGRDGAVVTCLWSQSQTYKDTPETASGRMTLVFKRVGKDWKAVHLHTSPDKEDPSRVLPSEQTPSPTPTPTPTPARAR